MFKERNLSVVGFIAFMLTAVVCWWLISAALSNSPIDSIVAFRYPVVMPSNPSVCPGDTLIYRQEMRVRYTPATVRLTVTVWNPVDERTVVPEDSPRWLNYPDPVTVRATNTYVVPSLLPGKYELRAAASGEGHKTSNYSVPFEVKSGCPT